jgi:hypothetical protein
MAIGCGLLLPDHDHERNLFIHERRPVRKIESVTPRVVEVTAIDDGAINLEQVTELNQRVANEACIVLTLRTRLVVPPRTGQALRCGVCGANARSRLRR